MKDLLNQTVTTEQSFDCWWRETGQFIGVASQATGDELELLRRYAAETHGIHTETIDRLQDKVDKLESDLSEAEVLRANDLAELRDKVDNALSDEFESQAAMAEAIKEAIKTE